MSAETLPNVNQYTSPINSNVAAPMTTTSESFNRPEDLLNSVHHHNEEEFSTVGDGKLPSTHYGPED